MMTINAAWDATFFEDSKTAMHYITFILRPREEAKMVPEMITEWLDE